MDFISEINTPVIRFISVNGIFKVFFLLLVFFYILYNVFLALRVRILHDTVKNKSETLTPLISYLNLIVTFIGSLIVVILILLG